MYVDALDLLAIDISTEVWTLVYDQALFSLFMGEVCECGSKESRANYQVIIFLHNCICRSLGAKLLIKIDIQRKNEHIFLSRRICSFLFSRLVFEFFCLLSQISRISVQLSISPIFQIVGPHIFLIMFHEICILIVYIVTRCRVNLLFPIV